MSQTSIRFNRTSSISKQGHRTQEKIVKRFSDINIVFVEGRDRINAEDEKIKVANKKNDLIKIFKEKYINFDETVVSKKFADGAKYEGRVNSDNEKHGKGIYYYGNGDIYLGDFNRNKIEGEGVYCFS
jgi:hypothetical protein